MMLAIRLPADIEERLDRLAKATGRTKAFYAREAILEDLEDLYLAEQRFIDNQAGRSRTYTLEELERELGLEDRVRLTITGDLTRCETFSTTRYGSLMTRPATLDYSDPEDPRHVLLHSSQGYTA